MSVLIIEDDQAFAKVLGLRCHQLGLTSRVAGTATGALTMLEEEVPDLILLDLAIPCEVGASSSSYGMFFCETLPRSVFSTVPVIVLSGSNDEKIKACCQLAGALYVPKGPDAWGVLKPVIIKLLKLETKTTPTAATRSFPQPTDSLNDARYGPKILCVDDDPDINLAIGMRLRQLGAYPIRAFNGSQAFQTALTERPDLILTDLHMPNGEGNYLISRLKTNPLTQDIPVVVLTAVCNPGVARTLRSLGADGFLTKPLDVPAVVTELSRFVRLPNL